MYIILQELASEGAEAVAVEARSVTVVSVLINRRLLPEKISMIGNKYEGILKSTHRESG